MRTQHQCNSEEAVSNAAGRKPGGRRGIFSLGESDVQREAAAGLPCVSLHHLAVVARQHDERAVPEALIL